MITLLTDFGTTDYFVGAMKGVILSVNADARIVDITHEIPAYDVEAAAFTLLASYQAFPLKTIHVAVVDPGVGSDRRPILVSSDKYLFVGPDNGLFSYVCDREAVCRVYHLTNEDYFRHPVSSTFHGRDIFAPVAAALSKNVDPAILGDEITDYKRLLPLVPHETDEGNIEARVIHIDRFGNCITNLTRIDLTEGMIAKGGSLQIGDHEVISFRNFFSDTNSKPGEIFGVWGSAGFLEIASFRSSAASKLGVERGERVIVTRLK